MNSSGSVVAYYGYDPYGRIIGTVGDLAEINPLRYRGYYYDNETGFYYCQNRYYDPAICRFINADSYASTGQGILGNNMFAYCLNNPVIFSDDSGRLPTIKGYFSPNAMTYMGGGYYSGISDEQQRQEEKEKLQRQGKSIFNTSEAAVLATEDYAMYNGIPVIKLPIGRNAFSYGIILIGDDVESVDTVCHEYGHSVHFSQIGIMSYSVTIMVPSLAGFWGGVKYDYYYSQPWEYIAEKLGGVNRTPYMYLPFSEISAAIYWIYTLAISGGGL